MDRHSDPIAHASSSHRRRPVAAQRTLRFEPLEDRRLLATITINTTDDVVDLDDGRTSLREAIFAANLIEGPDEIRFDFGHDGLATIRLTEGELKITDDLAITGTSSNRLTIDASGNDPTPEEKNGDGSRIFNIDNGDLNDSIHVVISGLRLAGGDSLLPGGAIYSTEDLHIENSIVELNSSKQGAAGIAQRSGKLVLSGSVLRNNRGANGGAISIVTGELDVNASSISGNSGGYGGGIELHSSHGRFSNSTIELNSGGRGGGIYASSGILDVRNCMITGNIAVAEGGGIMTEQTTLQIDGSTMRGNSAYSGGALWCIGDVNIISSSIESNVATEDGGGVILSYGESLVSKSTFRMNHAGRYGGAISNSIRSDVRIEQSLIISNRADSSGGGISSVEVLNSTLVVVDSALYANLALVGGGAIASSTLSMLNSTVTRNSAMGQGGGLLLGGNLQIEPTYDVRHSTIFDNAVNTSEPSMASFGGGIFVSTGRLQLSHSIVGGNMGFIGPDLTRLIGASFDLRFSLISYSSDSGLEESPPGEPDASGNWIGGPVNGFLNPDLIELLGNGRPVYMLAPLPDSPAVNAGDPNAQPGVDGTPLYDQRGEPFTRVGGGRIDIGAYESAMTLLPGDFNLDGIVDAADYPVWRSAMDQQVAPYTGADANGDALVDHHDYLIWKWNFGASRAVSISAHAPVEVESTADRAFAELEMGTSAARSKDERPMPVSDLRRFAPPDARHAPSSNFGTTREHLRGAQPFIPESLADTRRIELIAALVPTLSAEVDASLLSHYRVPDEGTAIADAAFHEFALLSAVWG